MAELVIEIIGQHTESSRFRRFDLPVVRIGRALDNDIIIADPYLSAHHLEITAVGDSQWQVRDVGSENGTCLKSGQKIADAVVASGAELTAGRTRLRVFDRRHLMGPARPLHNTAGRLERLDRSAVMVGAMALLTVCSIAYEYCSAASKEALGKFWVGGLWMSVGVVIASVLLTGFWALIGRLARHRARFRLQFVILILFFLVMSLVWPLLGYFSYVVDNRLVSILSSVLGLVPFLYALNCNLAVATPLSGAARGKLLAGFAGLFLAITALSYFHWRDEFRYAPDYEISVYPPVPGIRLGRAPDVFFDRAQDVFAIDIDESDE